MTMMTICHIDDDGVDSAAVVSEGTFFCKENEHEETSREVGAVGLPGAVSVASLMVLLAE